MAFLIYPAGTEIGSFILESFLDRDDAGCLYLARNKADNSPVSVKVLNGGLTPELLREAAVFSSENSLPFIRVLGTGEERSGLIVMEYICALSLAEHILAGKRFSGNELKQITLSLADALDLLHAGGLEKRSLTVDNIFLCGETIRIGGIGAVSRNSAVSDACTVLQKIADSAAEDASPLAARLKKLDPAEGISGIRDAISAPQSVPGKSGAVKTAVVLLSCGVLAAGAWGTYRYMEHSAEKNPPPLRVVENTLSASYHSPGIAVHKLSALPAKPAPVKSAPEKRKPVKSVPKPVKKTHIAKAPAAPPEKKAPAVIADAAARGNIRLLRRLILEKHDVNLPDANGKTAMFYAAAAGWTGMIDMLVNAGAKITPADIAGAKDRFTRSYLIAKMNGTPIPARTRPAVQSAPPRPVQPSTANWLRSKKRWHITLESAVAEAVKDRKKILVLITGSDWCPPCKKLDKEVLDSAAFRKLTKNLELLYIDMPKHKKMPESQRKYNSNLERSLRRSGGVPATLILDSRGKPLRTIVGFRNRDHYLLQLDRMLKSTPSR